MIKIVNEAINRKLASMSFTNIVTGKVESISPLQIKINNRIVIGQSFIEPMSLGLNDYSPSSALPLVVGETVQMIRYNNGQRFYILGKTVSASVVDYSQLQNLPKLVTAVADPLEPTEEPIKDEVILHKIAKSGCFTDLCRKPILNTNNTTAQVVKDSEEINNTINLHKIAKTGNYNDLLNLPTFAKVATSGSYNDLNNIPSLANVATSGSYKDLKDKPYYIDANVPTISDCNDSTLKTGFYWANAETVNTPISSGWYIQHINMGTNYKYQLAFRYTLNQIYSRNYNSADGTADWSEWIPVMNQASMANTYSTLNTLTYSASFINNNIKPKILWSGDIVPTAYNTSVGDSFLSSALRGYQFEMGYAHFIIDGTHYMLPFRFTTYGEGRTFCGQWAINSGVYCYLTFFANGYAGFSYQVKEMAGKTLEQVHLVEIIGLFTNNWG